MHTHLVNGCESLLEVFLDIVHDSWGGVSDVAVSNAVATSFHVTSRHITPRQVMSHHATLANLTKSTQNQIKYNSDKIK